MAFGFLNKKNIKENNMKKVMIIGCGRFGSNIASLLSESNHSVAVIDINRLAFRKLSNSFGGFSIEGEGTDIDLLVSEGIKETDILIASTNDDNTNIMIGEIGKTIFGIEKVIIRIYDSSKEVAYKNMDIISICPTLLAVKEFKRIISTEENES